MVPLVRAHALQLEGSCVAVGWKRIWLSNHFRSKRSFPRMGMVEPGLSRSPLVALRGAVLGEEQ